MTRHVTSGPKGIVPPRVTLTNAALAEVSCNLRSLASDKRHESRVLTGAGHDSDAEDAQILANAYQAAASCVDDMIARRVRSGGRQ
jgi:hypothetical protein